MKQETKNPTGGGNDMAKTKTTAISNEEIVAALLQCGTVKEAAEAIGTTPRTVYDRMQDRDFRALYAEAKDELIRKAVFSINSKLEDAIDAVAGIMNDTGANPAVRLQAAQTIINNAAKFAERLKADEHYSRELSQPPYIAGFDFD